MLNNIGLSANGNGFQVKVERAKEHIAALEAEVTAFRTKCDHELESDSQTGEWVFRAVVPEQVPSRFGAIAGDAIHNLRTSLNVLWRTFYPGKRIGDDFPITTAKDFEQRAAKVRPTRKAIWDILKTVEPFKGGRSSLWALHTLDNENKHHTLLPVVSAVQEMTYDPTAGLRQIYLARTGQVTGRSSLRRELNPAVCPVTHGTELLRYPINPHGPQSDLNPKFHFDVAFGECEDVEGKPIIPTLHQFTAAVEQIVEACVAKGLITRV